MYHRLEAQRFCGVSAEGLAGEREPAGRVARRTVVRAGGQG